MSSAIYGQLVKAQFENLTSDPSSPSDGLVYLKTDTDDLRFYDGAAWRSVATLNGSQTLTNKTMGSTNTLTGVTMASITNTGTVTFFTSSDTVVGKATTDILTNKDIDGGTASNTSRITLPKNTTGNLSGLTRKAGTLLFDTTTGLVNVDNGVTLAALSAASAATPTSQGLVTTFVPAIASAVKTVSSAGYTILDTDGYDVINVTTGASDRIIVLPTAADNAGRKITIVKVDSGAGFVTVDGEGSETIDGALNNTLHKQGSKVTLCGDGTGWTVISAVDYLYLSYTNTSITTSLASQAGIGISPGLWRVYGYIATVGGNGTTKAFDVSITSSAGGSGSLGDTRFFLPLNSSYGGGMAEILPIRLTSDTSYYFNAATLDSGTATSTYGYICAERIG